MHDQYPSGGEFAGPGELGRVLNLGADWLIPNGNYVAEGGTVVDEHNGFPVATRQARYYHEIPIVKLDEIAPGVSDVIELDGPLKLSYWVPCYKLGNEGELSFCSAALMVEVPKSDDSEISEDCLIISREEDEEVRSGREPIYRHKGHVGLMELMLEFDRAERTGEISEVVEKEISARSFAEQMGIAHVNLEELAAIERVFQALSSNPS
jgi:hypothetical protein